MSESSVKRQARQLRDTALKRLSEALREAGAVEGSAEYLDSRLADVDGVPHLLDDQGIARPINHETVSELLPNSLKKARRGLQSDRLQDLDIEIDEQQEVVNRIRQQHNRNPGDNALMTQHRFENKKLKTLKAERSEVLAERKADRQGPGPLPRKVTPAELAKYENFKRSLERLEQRYRDSGGRDNHALAKASGMRKQLRQMKHDLNI